MNYSDLMPQVVISAFATVGLIEVIKNFIKTEKKWIFSLIMIPLSIGTYFAAVCLPVWVIGGNPYCRSNSGMLSSNNSIVAEYCRSSNT